MYHCERKRGRPGNEATNAAVGERFMGRGFTSVEQESGSVFSVAVCKYAQGAP